MFNLELGGWDGAAGLLGDSLVLDVPLMIVHITAQREMLRARSSEKREIALWIT